ncbi:MAG: TrbC/VirB2 family protein [Candidatus Altiarchaeota archaeon]
MKLKTAITAFLLVLFVLPHAVYANTAFAGNITPKVSSVLCGFYNAFKSIATGIAALVMVLAGVKWVASENDPGARKAAKDAMIHAVVGLMIITLIGTVINMAGAGTPMCGDAT